MKQKLTELDNGRIISSDQVDQLSDDQVRQQFYEMSQRNENRKNDIDQILEDAKKGIFR